MSTPLPSTSTMSSVRAVPPHHTPRRSSMVHEALRLTPFTPQKDFAKPAAQPTEAGANQGGNLDAIVTDVYENKQVEQDGAKAAGDLSRSPSIASSSPTFGAENMERNGIPVGKEGKWLNLN